MAKNIAKGCILVPVKYDTVEKVKKYCKERRVEFIHERWIHRRVKNDKS